MSETAASRLKAGDRINRRLEEGATHAEVAVADGVSPQAVSKAAWLARTYSAGARHALGRKLLANLTPSHLEVVAAQEPHARVALLRQAAEGRLSVRQLRQACRLSAETSASAVSEPKLKVVGTATELVGASEAAHRYATWDNQALLKVLRGPHGTIIRDLAAAGRELASRIEEVMPAEQPFV